MPCHICGQEAVDRCYTCGQLFCRDHGQRECTRCQNAVMSGDPRPEHITARPASRSGRAGWWRPQVAEDYEPPACHICKGIARQICRNCQQLYCPDHAGQNDLCSACNSSSYLGLVVFGSTMAFLGIFMLFGLIPEEVSRQLGTILIGFTVLCFVSALTWIMAVLVYNSLIGGITYQPLYRFCLKSMAMLLGVNLVTLIPGGIFLAPVVWWLALVFLFRVDTWKAAVLALIIGGIQFLMVLLVALRLG